MGRIEEIARLVYRELWLRKLPHGLVSWRYLLPIQDERIRFHRRLWWTSGSDYPRWLWLLMECWLWLRWVFFHGWLACWRQWRQRGLQVEQDQGVSRWKQARRLMALSLSSCVPPQAVYQFQLYGDPALAWDYVYDQQVGYYHRWRNRTDPRARTSKRLLADKLRQTQTMKAAGIPTAPILECVPRNLSEKSGIEELVSWLDSQPRLFCKTRSGNRGLGAFAVWKTADDLQGQRFSGEELSNKEEVRQAWRELVKSDDVLIQPALENHPRLAPLAAGDQAITVRYISRFSDGEPSCLSATLEVPAGRNARLQPVYVILPIDPETGVAHPFPEHLLSHTEAVKRQADVLQRFPDRHIPHWLQLGEFSRKAHAQTPGLWAVAWDWVITPAGPLLLEGNTGWGAGIPQLLTGGFLGNAAVETAALNREGPRFRRNIRIAS